MERNKAFWAASKAISKATWTLQSRVHLIQPSLIWLFILPSSSSEVWEPECQMTWAMTEFRSEKSQPVKGQLRVHLPSDCQAPTNNGVWVNCLLSSQEITWAELGKGPGENEQRRPWRSGPVCSVARAEDRMSLCFPSAMARPALMKSPIGPESPHLVLPQSVIALTASHSFGCKFLFAPVTWGGGCCFSVTWSFPLEYYMIEFTKLDVQVDGVGWTYSHGSFWKKE